MTTVFLASALSMISSFAVLAGWIMPWATGGEAAAAWFAVSAATAFLSASALDA